MKRYCMMAVISSALLALVLASAVSASGLPGAAETPGAGAAWQETSQPLYIRWSTESEVDTAGFNLYRAESEEGPWIKINERLIPASPDPLRGGSYVFTDTAVIAGQTYWYELEEVELQGNAARLQRIQATAEPAPTGIFDGLPCISGLLLVAALGVVVGRHSLSQRQWP